MLPGVHPRSEQARTIHELHDRLQVDPRRGVGRGVASARRSRRLLPPGSAHRARHAGRECARAHRAPLSARHAPPLWRAGMARDAAPARGRGPPLGLSAVLALRLALALAPILPTALSIGLLLGAVSASAGSPRRYCASRLAVAATLPSWILARPVLWSLRIRFRTSPACNRWDRASSPIPAPAAS